MVSVYKPHSEGDGNLVVLMHSSAPGNQPVALTDESGRVLDRGRYVGRTNGGRPTYRFSRPGHAYRGLRVAINAGGQIFPIGNPALRDENVRPGSLGAVYDSTVDPIQSAQREGRPTQARMRTTATRNPLLPAAAAVSPLLTEGGRGKVTDWLDSGFTSLRNIGKMFSPGPSAPSTSGLFGNPNVTPATMTGGGGGAIGAINAAAPWAIGGTAVLTALRGILGDSAEERFMPMMEQYMAGRPRTLAEIPQGGSARNSYNSPIPSANNVFENAAAVSKRSGKPVPTKPTVGDYGVFTSNDKPFVKVPGDSPMLDSLRRGDIKASGVSTQPGGTALAANTYARVKNAFDWRERVKQEEQRGGK